MNKKEFAKIPIISHSNLALIWALSKKVAGYEEAQLELAKRNVDIYKIHIAEEAINIFSSKCLNLYIKNRKSVKEGIVEYLRRLALQSFEKGGSEGADYNKYRINGITFCFDEKGNQIILKSIITHKNFGSNQGLNINRKKLKVNITADTENIYKSAWEEILKAKKLDDIEVQINKKGIRKVPVYPLDISIIDKSKLICNKHSLCQLKNITKKNLALFGKTLKHFSQLHLKRFLFLQLLPLYFYGLKLMIICGS